MRSCLRRLHAEGMTADPNVNAQVSATVRGLLAYRQASPEVVMHALGMSKATWQRRLKGERDWTAAEVGALAQFFDVPVQLLYVGLPDLSPRHHPDSGISKTA